MGRTIPWSEVSVSTAPPLPIGTATNLSGGGADTNRSRPPSGGVAPLDTTPFQGYDEDEKLSPLGTGLGPIGPPSRLSKSNMTPPLPAMSMSGGSKPSSAPPSAHSFSPSAAHLPHSKTSPPSALGGGGDVVMGGGAGGGGGVNISPQQRNEITSMVKSPLLGAAPPGLLPPPDKCELIVVAKVLHDPIHVGLSGQTSLSAYSLNCVLIITFLLL